MMRVWAWMRSLARARPCCHAARDAYQRAVCSVFRGAAASQSRAPRLIRALHTGRAAWGRPSSLSLQAVRCYATSVRSEDVSVDVGLSVEGEPNLRCCTCQRGAIAASFGVIPLGRMCGHSTCRNWTASGVVLRRCTPWPCPLHTCLAALHVSALQRPGAGNSV